MPPKLIARLFRFQNAVARLSSPQSSIAEVAVACGYYDQAHLDRDFRDFLETTPSDFSAAVTKFQSAGVDTVWLHVAPDLSTKFAAQAKLLGYQPQYVFTIPVGGDIWAAAAGGNLDKAFGLAGFADPQWSGTAKFQEAFHKYYPDEQADEFNLLCYAIGVVYVEGLKKAGADLGRDAFAKAMGVSRTTASNIERGHQRLFLDQVYRAAEILGVAIEVLLPAQQPSEQRPVVHAAADDPLSRDGARQVAEVARELVAGQSTKRRTTRKV